MEKAKHVYWYIKLVAYALAGQPNISWKDNNHLDMQIPYLVLPVVMR